MNYEQLEEMLCELCHLYEATGQTLPRAIELWWKEYTERH